MVIKKFSLDPKPEKEGQLIIFNLNQMVRFSIEKQINPRFSTQEQINFTEEARAEHEYHYKLEKTFNVLDEYGSLYSRVFFFKNEMELKQELLKFIDVKDFKSLEPKILALQVESEDNVKNN